MAEKRIILQNIEPDIDDDSKEIATVIINRLGLMPRKKGSTEKMNQVLIELYERAKKASREKKPTLALMTVEEMGLCADITRQTMYDYLKRWIDLDLIVISQLCEWYIKCASPEIRSWMESHAIPEAIKKGLKLGVVIFDGTVFKKYFLNLIMFTFQKYRVPFKFVNSYEEAIDFIEKLELVESE